MCLNELYITLATETKMCPEVTDMRNTTWAESSPGSILTHECRTGFIGMIELLSGCSLVRILRQY